MSLIDVLAEPKAKQAHIWERDSLDWYIDPPRATKQLLIVEKFSGRIHDPACGQGNIVKELIVAGYSATGSDIKRRVGAEPWFTSEIDFLKHDFSPFGLVPNLVFNPPFFKAKGAEAFIRRALPLASGKVCAFVDIRFIAGAERADGLFAEHPPHRIWIVTPRVSCPPGDFLAAGGKAGNGSSDWCWLVWDRTAPYAATTLGWLRRT